MSNAEKPGFSYPLETVLQCRQWSVDRIHVRIVAARHTCAQLQQKIEELVAAQEAQVASGRTAWTGSPDAEARRRLLSYVSYLRTKRARFDEQLEVARTTLRSLEQSLREELIKLNVLEEHRSVLRTEYVLDQQRLGHTQSDVQWLALSPWRKAHSEGTGS